MPPALSTTSATKPRGTAAWLVVTGLLLGLLCLAHLTRPALAHPQAAHRPVPPDSVLILLTTWQR